MFKKLSETCALVGLLSFFASLTICIIADLLDEYLHMGAASLYKYLMIMASVTILIFVVSSIILWLFQWIYVFQGWIRRSLSFNLALIAFLLAGNFLAAYVMHFVTQGSLTKGKQDKD